MRKRIRIGQLRVGMFVEEVEVGRRSSVNACLIQDHRELEKFMASEAISIIIDTGKGIDVRKDHPPNLVAGNSNVEHHLKKFSAEELFEARSTIAKAAPTIAQMMSASRNMSLAYECADAVVSDLMVAASSNATALIGLTRLKKADECSFLHSLSVSVLMICLGRALDLDEAEVRELGIGGLVHDIGKTKIPGKILRKPGALTSEEFDVVKNHAEFGYEMLRETVGVSPGVLDICRYHHEKYDGTGYPLRLAGNDIPPFARIAAICDVYDALTTIRPYKRAWTQPQAIEWMTKSEGHFDPEFLKVFVTLWSDPKND